MNSLKLVFDLRVWNETGDIGDNSVFWHVAEIIHDNGVCATVRFLHDDHISSGHYLSAMREITPSHNEDTQPIVFYYLITSNDHGPIFMRRNVLELDDFLHRYFGDGSAEEYKVDDPDKIPKMTQMIWNRGDTRIVEYWTCDSGSWAATIEHTIK